MEHFKKRFKNRPIDDEIMKIDRSLLGDEFCDGGDRWCGFTQGFQLSYLCEIYNDTNAYIEINIHGEPFEDCDTPQTVAAYIKGMVSAIHPGFSYTEKKMTEDVVSLTFDWSWNE